MPRKKISTTPEDVIDGVPELDDDEQFVSETTTKRTIRKEKVTPADNAEPVDAAFDADIEDEPYDEGFPDDSLAATWYGQGGNAPENPYFNIHIRRNPDSLGDKFINPTNSAMRLAPLRNVAMHVSRSEIEDIVRNLYGGGHYFFQLYHNGQLGKGWTETLADPPEAINKARQEALGLPTHTPPVELPQANPFDQFFDTLKRQREMKDLLFGDEQKRLEAEIERLKTENAASVKPQSEKLVLLETALQASNPTLQERLLEHLFPAPEESQSHWIVDLFKTAFEHKAELAGLAQMLLGGMPQPATPNIESLLRQPPPLSVLPEVPKEPSLFRRNRPEAEAVTIDNDVSSDTTGLDAAEQNGTADEPND